MYRPGRISHQKFIAISEEVSSNLQDCLLLNGSSAASQVRHQASRAPRKAQPMPGNLSTNDYEQQPSHISKAIQVQFPEISHPLDPFQD